jgi:hypothetical protein
MRNFQRIVQGVVLGLAVLLAPLGAMSHHSFSAEFDVGRPVDLTGTVTKIEWVNPHAWVYLEAENSGQVQSWAVEMLGINALIRSGMRPDNVKVGDRLTITGFGARNGTNRANASSVTRTENGEVLWASAGQGSN